MWSVKEEIEETDGSTTFRTELSLVQGYQVLEAKFYGLNLVLGLIVVGLGLTSCGLVLLHLGLVTSIIRKSMEVMNYLPCFQCCL